MVHCAVRYGIPGSMVSCSTACAVVRLLLCVPTLTSVAPSSILFPPPPFPPSLPPSLPPTALPFLPGITTFQLDIKCAGLTTALLGRALTQAKAGRLHILGEMSKGLPDGPRKSLSQFVPAATVIHVDPDQIGKVGGWVDGWDVAEWCGVG